MRAASANVDSGSIQCSDCEQVTISAHASSSPVSTRQPLPIGYALIARALPSLPPHVRVWLHAYDALRPPGPYPRGQPRAASQVHDQPRHRSLGKLSKQIHNHIRRRRPIHIIAIGESAEALDIGARIVGHTYLPFGCGEDAALDCCGECHLTARHTPSTIEWCQIPPELESRRSAPPSSCAPRPMLNGFASSPSTAAHGRSPSPSPTGPTTRSPMPRRTGSRSICSNCALGGSCHQSSSWLARSRLANR